MQWDASPAAGFSDGLPWLPVATDYPQINVAVERQDPSSILSLYRRLIALRRASPALTHGAYRAVAVDEDVLCYERAQSRSAVAGSAQFRRPAKKVYAPILVGTAVLLSTDTQDVDLAVPFVLDRMKGSSSGTPRREGVPHDQ